MRILRDLTLNIAPNATNISPSSSLSSSMANSNVMMKNSHHETWKSPIPYLFGSLALMLLLISIALVLLVFSYRKSSTSRHGHDHHHDDDQKKPPKAIEAVDLEPKIVVIMPGDDKPTYLAAPSLTIAMPSTNICSCGDQIKSCDQD